MIKIRNKRIALLLVLAMLATMFVGVGTASASTTYSALTTPTVTANTAGYAVGPPVVPGQNLGIIQVDISSGAAVTAGDVLTIALPTTIEFPDALAATKTLGAAPAGGAGVKEVFVPTDVNGTGNGNGLTAAMGAGTTLNVNAAKTTLDITFGAAGTALPGQMFIYLRGMKVGAVDGDITAQLQAPANSAFASGSVVIGKATTSTGNANVSIASVKTIGSAGGAIDTMTLTETMPGALNAGDIIKVKLPQGYTWGAPYTVAQAWGFAGAGACTALVNAADARILDVTPVAPTFPSVATAGKITFTGTIIVDDAVATVGDIQAHVYDANSRFTETDMVIAKYADYGVTVNQETTKELTAGVADQKIGTFNIAENLAGSLFPGRSITFTLPQGVKWSGAYRVGNAYPVATMPNGTQTITPFAVGVSDNGSTNSGTTIKANVGAVPGATKTKFKFEGLKVDVSPSFTGDIKLTVGGTAGAVGEIVLGTVKSAVTLSAENVKDLKIGVQDQALGDLVIIESKKEAVLKSTPAITVSGTAGVAVAATTTGAITLTLPGGAEWSAGYPTVTVTEGDLQLNTASMSKAGATLTIPVKSSSVKPSTIKITNMKATLYRTVPEGAFQIAVAGSAINQTGGAIGGVNLAFPQYEDNAVTVANNVSAASAVVNNVASFVIGASKYTLNGNDVDAFAASYVKDSRTYLAIRDIAAAIGIDQNNVMWDGTKNTVTLMKGDKVVQLTIGSKTILINGAAVTMDVAPEVGPGNRTMLPAAFIAQAFGATASWDAATSTVTIK